MDVAGNSTCRFPGAATLREVPSSSLISMGCLISSRALEAGTRAVARGNLSVLPERSRMFEHRPEEERRLPPPMRHPFFEGLRPTLHIAHRGGALLAPENTLPAFRAAVERWQTDMLELDVHATRDGELVVSHDPTLQRCTDGEGRIGDHTLDQIQQLDAGFHFSPDGGRTTPFRGRAVRIPTFREVLRAFPRMRLNVEVKAEAPGVESA